jgi:aspartate 1-decarboxylase
MRRIMLKAKIHNAVVTETNKAYEGSLTLDEDLLDKAGLIPFEQVHIYNITNGERFVTYLIKGERGSGTVGINGAAVHKANTGDRIILAAYGLIDEKETDFFIPKILILDDRNQIKKIKS